MMKSTLRKQIVSPKRVSKVDLELNLTRKKKELDKVETVILETIKEARGHEERDLK